MSHKPNYHYCLLGAIGWAHPAWQGDFYPEDLPPEWQLNFYSTAFGCVYLPYAQWHAASSETLAEWHHDTREEFRFLLESAETPQAEDTLKIAALRDKAVLVKARQMPNLLWLEPEVDLKHLAKSLQTLEPNPPFYLISLSADLAQLEQARTLLEVLGY